MNFLLDVTLLSATNNKIWDPRRLFQYVRLSLFNLLIIKLHPPEQRVKAEFIMYRIIYCFFLKGKASYHCLTSKE